MIKPYQSVFVTLGDEEYPVPVLENKLEWLWFHI
jgi:hypothetical protein